MTEERVTEALARAEAAASAFAGERVGLEAMQLRSGEMAHGFTIVHREEPVLTIRPSPVARAIIAFIESGPADLRDALETIARVHAALKRRQNLIVTINEKPNEIVAAAIGADPAGPVVAYEAIVEALDAPT